MKIVCSRQTFPEQTNERTNGHLHFLSSCRSQKQICLSEWLTDISGSTTRSSSSGKSLHNKVRKYKEIMTVLLVLLLWNNINFFLAPSIRLDPSATFLYFKSQNYSLKALSIPRAFLQVFLYIGAYSAHTSSDSRSLKYFVLLAISSEGSTEFQSKLWEGKWEHPQATVRGVHWTAAKFLHNSLYSGINNLLLINKQVGGGKVDN